MDAQDYKMPPADQEYAVPPHLYRSRTKPDEMPSVVWDDPENIPIRDQIMEAITLASQTGYTGKLPKMISSVFGQKIMFGEDNLGCYIGFLGRLWRLEP